MFLPKNGIKSFDIFRHSWIFSGNLKLFCIFSERIPGGEPSGTKGGAMFGGPASGKEWDSNSVVCPVRGRPPAGSDCA